jgi:hypothetical protein
MFALPIRRLLAAVRRVNYRGVEFYRVENVSKPAATCLFQGCYNRCSWILFQKSADIDA